MSLKNTVQSFAGTCSRSTSDRRISSAGVEAAASKSSMASLSSGSPVKPKDWIVRTTVASEVPMRAPSSAAELASTISRFSRTKPTTRSPALPRRCEAPPSRSSNSILFTGTLTPHRDHR